jgi:hypothetical protein
MVDHFAKALDLRGSGLRLCCYQLRVVRPNEGGADGFHGRGDDATRGNDGD